MLIKAIREDLEKIEKQADGMSIFAKMLQSAVESRQDYKLCLMHLRFLRETISHLQGSITGLTAQVMDTTPRKYLRGTQGEIIPIDPKAVVNDTVEEPILKIGEPLKN